MQVEPYTELQLFTDLPTAPLDSESEDDEDILQLLPYLPDLIVHRHHDAPLPQTEHSYGVIMFADISGTGSLHNYFV